MERDEYLLFLPTLLYISTHTLTWSVTGVGGRIEKRQRFQLTRSRGAWHLAKPKTIKGVEISTHTLTWSVTRQMQKSRATFSFQLTRSRGAWQKFGVINVVVVDFNSHAHVERDPNRLRSITDLRYFNSHAHVERDRFIYAYCWHVGISTHTLTWSVTTYYTISHFIFIISTHTLTWSVTLRYVWWRLSQSISTHTLTWSVTPLGVTKEKIKPYFNSHAHVERDQTPTKGV